MSQERYGIQNQAAEWSYTSGKTYTDPFNDIVLDVVFTDTEGEAWRVPTFWAGDHEWRVRFAAPHPGTYRYRTQCSDEHNPDLHGQEGVLHVNPYEGINDLLGHGPLRISTNVTGLLQSLLVTSLDLRLGVVPRTMSRSVPINTTPQMSHFCDRHLSIGRSSSVLRDHTHRLCSCAIDLTLIIKHLVTFCQPVDQSVYFRLHSQLLYRILVRFWAIVFVALITTQDQDYIKQFNKGGKACKRELSQASGRGDESH